MRTFRPDVPAALEEVILRCLEKNREARWTSIGELANALAPHAPAGSRLHAARANRGKSPSESAMRSATGHLSARTSGARPASSLLTDTRDPAATSAAPVSPTMVAGSPSGPCSAATLNSWTTGSGKRPANRVLWFALGGAFLALGGVGAVVALKRPQDSVAVPITVLSAPPALSAAPTSLTAEIAPGEAAPASPAASPPAVARPAASAAPVAVHVAPAKSAAPKHDAANRPPAGKVETISDFGGRR
jgi:eukaryotic-like serine/threonine-protein kinase